jgi:putative nucleotidyltransferase with HDIG domain
MNPANTQETIEVSALNVGMLIHLDGGWMSHPFPRSSFKISSLDQIATLRSLGLEKVRWTPSDTPVETPDKPLPPDVTADRRGSAADRRQRREVKATPPPPSVNGGERQFSEAAKASRRVFDHVAAQPAEARLLAEGLTRGLVDKMMGAEDMCIQLLGQTAGDRVSNHAVNVSVLSLLMGRYFALCESDMLDLGMGALLHDVGKSELPDRYRHREDHFNMAEISLYESHVASGSVHAQRLGLSDGAATIIAQHHECSDGRGFPLGLSTERTHMLSRIVALVNVYDNLCNPTNPAKSITPHEAVAHLFTQNHKQFDTAILGAFIKMMGVYPAGSVVQLTDDRYALVVGVNSSRTLRPRVIVHDPKVPRDVASVLDLESVPGLGIRRSLKSSALPESVLAYLELQPRMNYFFEPTAELRNVK